jgi:hypothetical protein
MFYNWQIYLPYVIYGRAGVYLFAMFNIYGCEGTAKERRLSTNLIIYIYLYTHIYGCVYGVPP